MRYTKLTSMNNYLVELTGFVGAVLLLGAFYLITVGRWSSKTQWYQLSNAAAGALLAYYTWEKAAYFAAAINLIWVVVAAAGLVRIRRKNTKK